MKKWLLIIPVIFLCGCAALQEMISEIPEVQPQAEIGAVSTLVQDVVKNPYDDMLAVGLGYALALLRRWYKKKMGSQA